MVIPLLLISQLTLAQATAFSKISRRDSVVLVKTWNAFKQALSKKDDLQLRTLSLKTVRCDLFDAEAILAPNYDPYIPISKFLKQFYRDTKLRMVVSSKHYHLSTDTVENFQPKNIKYQKTRNLITYEIWYVVWEPGELAKGHEGASDAFQFVKIGENFKFYGMTSIP